MINSLFLLANQLQTRPVRLFCGFSMHFAVVLQRIAFTVVNTVRAQKLLPTAAKIALLSASFSAPTIYAQQLVSDGVYKVEMIVLAHKSDNGISIDETWQQSVVTQYPRPIHSLKKNPEAEQILGVTNGNEAELAIAEASLMTHLPSAQREMNEMAMQMRLRKGYRLLFHEAWFQQFDGKKAQSLLIEGGKWFDPYFELSGSISLKRNRYLHLNADLWLAEFVSLDELAQTPWHARSERVAYLDLPTRDHAFGRKLRQSDSPRVNQSNLQLSQAINSTLYEYSNASVANVGQYRAKTVYALQQKRRIRSGEIHYLDHPKLGILIKLTKLNNAFED